VHDVPDVLYIQAEIGGVINGGMPPPKGYVRKIITVPPDVAAAVREYRFQHRLENDVEAYRILIAKGLEAAERENQKSDERARDGAVKK
jgi:hypothetical protein